MLAARAADALDAPARAPVPAPLRRGVQPPTDEHAGLAALPDGATCWPRPARSPRTPTRSPVLRRTTADASLDVSRIAGVETRTIVRRGPLRPAVRLAPGQARLRSRLRSRSCCTARCRGAELELGRRLASPSRFDPAARRTDRPRRDRAAWPQPRAVRSAARCRSWHAFADASRRIVAASAFRRTASRPTSRSSCGPRPQPRSARALYRGPRCGSARAPDEASRSSRCSAGSRPPGSVSERVAARLGRAVRARRCRVPAGRRRQPHGVAQVRYRWSVWWDTKDCWLEDLYHPPEARGAGLGRTLTRR